MRTITENDSVRGSVPPTYPTLKLLYLGGAGVSGRTYVPRPGVTLLGRAVSEDDGVPMPCDRLASSQHARIELGELRQAPDRTPYSLRLIDEGSKNGTFVNGERVTVTNLHDGDVIRVGGSLLLLRYEPARVLDARDDSILGSSPAIRLVRYQIQRVASTAVPVLLLGEPGVGKELAAQSLHRASGRRGKLIAVNCAAVPEHLAESLLFGHERGAFSGAYTRQEGFFQAAEGGTLFLDEVGELPPSVQGKLLRVLQERQVTVVGRTQSVPCDVRLVTATNRDLQGAVQGGGFRDDLYSRLRGEVITIASLRTRSEDILPLLLHALTLNTQLQARLSPRAAEALVLYHWPHNVREVWQMAQAIGHEVMDGLELDLPMLAPRLQPLLATPSMALRPTPARRRPLAQADPPPPRPLRLSPETLERLGRENQWNISKLARIVGRSRRQVRRWLQQHGLQTDETKGIPGSPT